MPERTDSDRPSAVPAEVAVVLGSTLQRILAEAAFADAWPRPELSADPDAIASCDLGMLLPVDAPWKGRLLLCGDLETVRDLAAGFHSIPDELADRSIAADFLAELGRIVTRDLFCASDLDLRLGAPEEVEPDRMRALWASAAASRAGLGCNQGCIFAALAGP